MYKASKARAVGRCVALEREKTMKWLDNERYLAIVNHLAGAGNPEACFIASSRSSATRLPTARALDALYMALQLKFKTIES